MSNNNPTGINGYGTKNYTSEDALRASFKQYAKEKLSVDERLERLRKEHNLNIKKSKLMELQKAHGWQSSRSNPTPNDIAAQAIMDIIDNDLAQGLGVLSIGILLAQDEFHVPRRVIREVLKTNAPDGLNSRFPGARQIHRVPLKAVGPDHQNHADGHDKLAAAGLRMGEVGFPMYVHKDQWSSIIHSFVIVPNNRLSTTIGHVHLDYIESIGGIPMTLVVDKGTETGYAFGHQWALREAYAPDLDTQMYPPVLQVKSVHNTPAESLWHWFTNHTGRSLKEALQHGLENGIYQPNNPLHISLFNWLWPPIVQGALDLFTECWNNHRIRRQDKPNASGCTPRHAYTVPESMGGQNCLVPVPQNAINALRAEIEVSRDDAFRWVDDDFAETAQGVYVALGKPLRSVSTGWAVFAQMLPLLQPTFQVVPM